MENIEGGGSRRLEERPRGEWTGGKHPPVMLRILSAIVVGVTVPSVVSA
jgi:hypothetical protein